MPGTGIAAFTPFVGEGWRTQNIGSSGIAAVVPEESAPLTYFTHEVDGRLRVGWWRRLQGRRIEVFTRARVRVEFLETDSPESIARRVLEELTREEDALLQAPPNGARKG